MGLVGAFDNRSLRTKIGTAVLAGTLSGVLVGAVALATLRGQNSDAAAAQRSTIAVSAATGDFAKNIEAFGGNTSAARLYPALRTTIEQGMEANKAAIQGALGRLRT